MATAPVHDINATVDYAASQAQKEIEELRRQVKELTEKYGAAAEGKLKDVKETMKQNMGELETQIRQKPVQATLIAAGVGFLLGALLTR